MSKLFIELYLDEDVNVVIADLIKARGFDALTARDAGQLRKSDREQLEFATNQQRVIVTHNRGDFEALANDYYVQGLDHSGIIIAVRCSPFKIADRLTAILNKVTADGIVNQVRYI
jgi:predicted nuclease of predicted toxin-antitoxin system